MLNLFKSKTTINNAMFTLQPYWHHGCWVFDDYTRGLLAEAFVCGMSEIITEMLIENGINPDEVRSGFRLTFSTNKFPNHTHSLSWDREGDTGNWYNCDQTGMSGWLCPALFLYYPQAPKKLYARADQIN